MRSGASTEPCRGRRIPGLARCRQGQRTSSVGLTAFGRSSWAPAGYEPSTEAMTRGQQLHPSRAPMEPQSGFLGRRRVRESAVANFPAEAFSVQLLFLDKVVDVPVVQLQCVDKVVAVPDGDHLVHNAGGRDSRLPQLQLVENAPSSQPVLRQGCRHARCCAAAR